MASSFAQLVGDFCYIAGLAPLPVQTDEEGSQIVQLELDGCGVDLLCESAGARRVFSRVLMRGIDLRDETNDWGAMLQANFALLCSGGPTFSRDPWRDVPVAQQVWPADISPQELHEAVRRQCAIVADWCAGRVDPDNKQQHALNAAPGAARVCLEQVAGKLRHLPGLEELAVRTGESGIAFFQLGVDSVDIHIFHMGRVEQEIQVFMTLGADIAMSPETDRQLAEANAWLIADANSPVLCRWPITGEAALSSTLRMQPETTGAALLHFIRRLAAALAPLRAHLMSH